MRKFTLLFITICALLSTQLFAQDALVLDPNEFVNDQIVGDTTAAGERLHTVYEVERDNIYFFDGRMDIDFECEIIGPDIASGAIVRDDAAGHPPTLGNVINNDGAAQQFIRIFEGGSLVMKNLIMSGSASNGTVTRVMVENTSGSKVIVDNVAFTDWEDFCIRNREVTAEISVTNCVFLNGVRLRYSQWGGMVMRIEAGTATKTTVENNTVVGASRLMCNAGPFLSNEMTVLHNTLIHQAKNAHEFRQKSFVGANNIYYNWDYAGYGYNQINGPDYYQAHFTTGMEFAGFGVEGGLDAVSSYFGQNLLYRSPELLTAYAGLDSFFLAGADEASGAGNEFGGYWEFASADSFFNLDDNFKVGTNYEGFDPMFTTPVGNDQAIADWATELNTPEDERPAEMTEIRIPSPMTYDEGTGAPSVSWPPAFDLSYTEPVLLTGGSNGLPLGDLNWFPADKATYMANRDLYITALKDSMVNAKAVYVPGSPTPLISPATAIDDEFSNNFTPGVYTLAQNYPNPFNPSTTIQYSIAKAGIVKIAVYNTLGQKIKTLVDDKQVAGTYKVSMNASNLASGIYYYSIQAGDFSETRKMILIK